MNWDWHIGSKTLLAIGLLSLVACSKERADCFEGRGEQVTEVRPLEAFRSLHLEDRMNVVLVQDSSDFLEVTYGENGLGGIVETMDGETLRISEDNRCDWMRKQDPLPQVRVHYTQLRHILSENSGSVKGENAFEGDSLKLEVEDVSGLIELQVNCDAVDIIAHTGATDIKASGTCGYVYIYNSGYAPIRAEDLISRTVSVHNNSTGDTYVNAWETLYYQIYHQGNIHLKGPASVVKWHQSGGGEVVF
mgnify:CR=1 FL=1